MRINLVTCLKSIVKLLSSGLDREKEYVVFPNGTKICWGIVGGMKYCGVVTLPVSFEEGVVIVVPLYNYVTSWRCTFSAVQVKGNSFQIYPYDTYTNTASTAENIAAAYIVIGY